MTSGSPVSREAIAAAPMIDAAYAALTAVGVPREQIHAERFLSGAAP